MSPRARNTPDFADARTDIYALGAVAYYLLAGVNVFEGRSVVEVCAQHLHEAPKPLSSDGICVSPELEQIILACLSKDPDDRPQSAAELGNGSRLAASRHGTARVRGLGGQSTKRSSMVELRQNVGEARTIAVDGEARTA